MSNASWTYVSGTTGCNATKVRYGLVNSFGTAVDCHYLAGSFPQGEAGSREQVGCM